MLFLHDISQINIKKRVLSMKKHILNSLSILFFTNIIFAASQQNAPEVPIDIQKIEIQQPEKATTGAITEAVFILQNRKNTCTDFIKKSKDMLEDVRVKNIIKLNDQKDVLSVPPAAGTTTDIAAISIAQTGGKIEESEKGRTNMILCFFPEYIKQLENIINHIEARIQAFGQDQNLLYSRLREEVEKINKAEEIIKVQDNLLEATFALAKQKAILDDCQKKITENQRNYGLFKNSESKKSSDYVQRKMSSIEKDLKEQFTKFIDAKSVYDLKKNKLVMLKKQLKTLFAEFSQLEESEKIINKLLMETFDKCQADLK